jgi:hypothetical protein
MLKINLLALATLTPFYSPASAEAITVKSYKGSKN